MDIGELVKKAKDEVHKRETAYKAFDVRHAVDGLRSSPFLTREERVALNGAVRVLVDVYLRLHDESVELGTEIDELLRQNSQIAPGNGCLECPYAE